MDCSLSGSSVHGIFQARVLEWIAISFSRGSSWPRGQTLVSRIAGRRFTIWATREAPHQTMLLISPADIEDECRDYESHGFRLNLLNLPNMIFGRSYWAFQIISDVILKRGITLISTHRPTERTQQGIAHKILNIQYILSSLLLIFVFIII